MDQFILFGDSITQQAFSQDTPPRHREPSGFFGPALADAYARKLDIINRGLSGYNTRQALQVLPQVVPTLQQARVRFLTIFFGANDARLPNTYPDPQQHVPLEEFRSNLKAIVSHPCLLEHKDIRIILITPPPVHERTALNADRIREPNREPVLRRTAAATATYAQAVRELGDEMNLPVLDLWSAMMDRAGYHDNGVDDRLVPGSVANADDHANAVLESFLHDGLHFTRAAYRVLYDGMMDLIQENWPDQTPDALPFVLPRWDDQEAWKEARGSVL
ncbi:uncharacterized protein LTR77_001841 [Saxophila tyrrhenica]|uniref:SGNH hydrolase-type esterase domain-containing protein n=1 Tax=Saxophila tyrrhenica TaxID=1690608 RepID=A0AAV9PP04_9PEZI|nr:hypothetical protein LTR77_001841 [Saxophila tyrrhenica]